MIRLIVLLLVVGALTIFLSMSRARKYKHSKAYVTLTRVLLFLPLFLAFTYFLIAIARPIRDAYVASCPSSFLWGDNSMGQVCHAPTLNIFERILVDNYVGLAAGLFETLAFFILMLVIPLLGLVLEGRYNKRVGEKFSLLSVEPYFTSLAIFLIAVCLLIYSQR